MLCFLAAAFILLGLTHVLAKNNKFVIKLKDKLMWSSLFRSVIQTYLPTCLMVFFMVQTAIEEQSLDVIKSSSSFVKLFSVCFVPVFSLIYLKRN